MSNNKITKQDISHLLASRFSDFLSLKDLPNPSTFKDMDRAVARIIQAITNKEKIVLIGDYDVDGVISTSIMIMFFRELGVELEWIIPNRFKDGYGLSLSLLERIDNANLIITVDNGISAIEAADRCKELGIDLIITDHHVVPLSPPDAYAIVNQKQKNCDFIYKDICGAQIAWYLCSALNRELKTKIDMKSYLGMVSIATIADIMPLIEINRAMVISGLQILSRSSSEFIVAYKEYKDINSFSSEDIAFGLAPILNSAGRLEDASLAVEFIVASTLYEARVSLEKLVGLNESRKAIEQDLTHEVVQSIKQNDNVIVAYARGWHEGVVGIVASRIKDKFNKPAIILNQTGEICKGSGRSIDGVNLFKLVEKHKEMLEKFGGHSAAIGLSISIENVEKFKRALNESFGDVKSDFENTSPDVIGELTFSEIDFELINIISQYEPYGEANQRPKFITKSVNVLAIQKMGKDKNHLRFTLENNGVIHNAVQFNTYDSYEIDEKIDIVYKVSVNHFRGESTIQLMIESVI